MSERGHIAMFVTDLTGGGAERVMVNLANGIANEGYKLDFIVAKERGVFIDHLPKTGRLVSLNSPAMLSAGKLAKYLRDERPQALLSALNQPNTVSVIAKKLSGAPTKIVASIHNTLAEEVRGAQNWRRKLMPLFAKRFFPLADEIVAVSKESAISNAQFLGIPESRISVILNPVVTPSLIAASALPVDHPWFAPGQPPVILGIGRLTRQKNFQMLIEAFQIVKSKVDARLIILGEGEDREDLEREVAERQLQDSVSLPGFASNPFAYLAQARVFALSSRWEGLPTVLIESLGAGTPVVSTDCPSGPKEILREGKFGLLSPVEDAPAFAESLLTELARPKVAPPAESFAPYELKPVTEQYLDLLLGPNRT